MLKLKKMFSLIKKPRKIIKKLGAKGVFNFMDDKTYLKLVYWGETGKRLDLKNPLTFNEKLQWLKLYDRKPEYSIYVDKFEVRKYITGTIGEDFLIPLIGVYKSVDDILWNELPKRFVIKCTHGSGSNIICWDKDNLNIKKAKKKLNKWMKKSWYWFGREWPYKAVKPRIIIEEYMTDETGIQLKDYKIFCFNGEPKLIQVDFDRFIDHKRNLYTIDWEYINARIAYPNCANILIPKPKSLDKMLDIARKLSKNIPHVRVDLYSVEDKIYFGEMTFFHGSGFEQFEPESFARKMGEWIKLPNIERMSDSRDK